jgi:hypothetical protein
MRRPYTRAVDGQGYAIDTGGMVPRPPPPPRRFGAEGLANLARHLNKTVVEHDTEGGPAGRTLDAVAGLNSNYVLVHVYLVPGNVTLRAPLRDSIHAALVEAPLLAEQLHDLAYAVPASRVDGLTTSDEVWRALMHAGSVNGQELWMEGDVIYVHYWRDEGFAVFAAAPRSGRPLPFAEEM